MKMRETANMIIPEVQVLLSTYNGQKYILQQLESIVLQSEASVNCLIKDDGSIDGTFNILNQYAKGHSNIQLANFGDNLGFARSFFELVKISGNYSYFAFSDQDDVWLPDKLKVAVNTINGFENIPCMYFCNCDLVDENLNRIRVMYDDLRLPDKKFERLLENRAAGCTIVFNRKARDMFLHANTAKIQYHDFWLYVICSYFGKVFYDPIPRILYRQHSNNQIGNRPSLSKLWRQRKKQLKNKEIHAREYMAQELLQHFDEQLTKEEKDQIAVIASYRTSVKDRLKLMLYKDAHMSSHKKQFWFRMHVLIGNV